ncbi:MAG: DUF3298 domain-containing protein, partial [Acidobacteria bacterium]|nr:DUF3298 domain-containing protein [Acidobacteriota bacterium]
LRLADLFKPGANYLEAISRYSVSDLKKRLGPEGVDDEWIQNGAGPDAGNYQGWNISKKGLAITFDPYQVASYAAGPQRVVIPYSVLKDIIKPDGPLAPFNK